MTLALEILSTWDEIVPLDKILGVPTLAGSCSSSSQVFEGHDENQIKFMEELCIVLDYNDVPVGAGTKKLCHLMENINGGLLHRAFLVFLFDTDNRLLLQQRADEKITFPNMWTNTCCSHPLCVPSELGATSNLESAIEGAKVAAQRKLEHELGIEALQCALDDFQFLTRIHYKSASGDLWGEHEIDYILVLRAKEPIVTKANHNEVRDIRFVSPDELKEMLKLDLVFTPWFKLICQTFLFEWWGNLDKLDKYVDDKIHRM